MKLRYFAVAVLISVAPLNAHAKSRAGARKVPMAPIQSRRQQAIELTKRAAIAYQRGDYSRVVVLCKNASNLAPTYARAYAWSGAAYQKLRNYPEARFAYRWVVALAPGTPDAIRAQRGLREISFG